MKNDRENPVKTGLHFYQWGEKHLPPMVFLHGFMGDGRSFEHLIKQIMHRFYCISFDLPGHGKSLFGQLPSLTRLQSISQLSQSILNDLNMLNIDRFYLYGYSMGGRIAQDMWLTSPQRVLHLFLESAAFGIKNRQEREARYQLDCERFAHIRTQKEFRAFIEDWYKLPLFCTLSPQKILPDLIQKRLQNCPQELQQALTLLSIGNHPYYLDKLINTPGSISYLFGTKDDKYQSIANQAARLKKNIHVKAFEQASHNIHIQYPQEISTYLLEWLVYPRLI